MKLWWIALGSHDAWLIRAATREDAIALCMEQYQEPVVRPQLIQEARERIREITIDGSPGVVESRGE